MAAALSPTAPKLGDAVEAPRLVVVAEDRRIARALLELLDVAGLPVADDALRVDELDALAHGEVLVVLAADVGRQAGMAVLRRIRRSAPAARVVVVAPDDGVPGAFHQVGRFALNGGAEAFLREADVGPALVHVIRAVLAGFVCAPRGERRLIAKPSFSQREKEVLQLVVEGLTNSEIAARLFLSESTVKTHLASAFSKLGVRSRKDAAALLLDPAEGLTATVLPVGR